MSLTMELPTKLFMRVLTEEYLTLHRKPIKKMLRKFLFKSGQGDKEFKKSIEAIESSTKDNSIYTAFVFDRGSGPEGYLLVQLVGIDIKILYIWQCFLSYAKFSRTEVKEFTDSLATFAKSMNCKKLIFYTSRNAKAYSRWLGTSWKQGPTQFERSL